MWTILRIESITFDQVSWSETCTLFDDSAWKKQINKSLGCVRFVIRPVKSPDISVKILCHANPIHALLWRPIATKARCFLYSWAELKNEYLRMWSMSYVCTHAGPIAGELRGAVRGSNIFPCFSASDATSFYYNDAINGIK